MQSDINQLATEIFKDGIELLKALLDEVKLKIREMRAVERNRNLR